MNREISKLLFDLQLYGDLLGEDESKFVKKVDTKYSIDLIGLSFLEKKKLKSIHKKIMKKAPQKDKIFNKYKIGSG